METQVPLLKSDGLRCSTLSPGHISLVCTSPSLYVTNANLSQPLAPQHLLEHCDVAHVVSEVHCETVFDAHPI